MKEKEVEGRIGELVGEEHDLWQKEADGKATVEDRARLKEVEVMLDQCWDLLRQRRALRRAGRDPDEASARSPEVVETYEQ